MQRHSSRDLRKSENKIDVNAQIPTILKTPKMNKGSVEKIDKFHGSESTDFALKPMDKLPSYTIPKIPIG